MVFWVPGGPLVGSTPAWLISYFDDLAFPIMDRLPAPVAPKMVAIAATVARAAGAAGQQLNFSRGKSG
eukprot:8963857-Lingulodinium_polyedra.AAC.1